MVCSIIVSAIPVTAFAEKPDTEPIKAKTSYTEVWSMVGAEYTAYTSYIAAQNALDNMKQGKPAGDEGIAITTNNEPAVFVIEKNGDSYTSNTLEFLIGEYFVIETKIPKGYNLDETIHTMKIVAGGEATTIMDGLVISMETPKFFEASIEKRISLATPLYTNEEYLASHPIIGAKYALFTNLADAEVVKNQIDSYAGSNKYPKTVPYSNVALDVNGNEAIFTISNNNGSCTPNSIWLDEDVTYYCIEVERPNGYLFDNNIYTISGNGNTQVSVTSTEREATTWIRVRKVWKNDAWVQTVNPQEYNLGVTWTLFKADGVSVVATGKTDARGEMVYDTVFPADNKPAVEVPIGNYILEETAIDQDSGKIYDRQRMTINATADNNINNVVEFTLRNEPYSPEFYFGLTKTLSTADEQYYDLSLVGTQFTVYYFLNDELSYNELFTTDENGRVVIKESMKNRAAKRWVLEAKDAETPSPVILDDGSEGIMLATTIYYNEDYLVGGDTFYHNELGETVALIGTYVFEETKTTEGFYAVDSWMWNMRNNGANTHIGWDEYPTIPKELTVAANRRQTVTIEIKKSSNNSDKPNYYGTLQGAEFRLEFFNENTGAWENATATDLILNQENDASLLVTDSEGRATSLPMKPGRYRLSEIKAPLGHTLNHVENGTINNNYFEFEIFIDPEEVYTSNGAINVVFYYDSEYTDRLTNHTTVNIFHKNGYTVNGDKKLLIGATVQLWEMNGDNYAVQLPLYGQMDYVTTGETIDLYGLHVGKTYRILEVKQPDGYLPPQGHEAYVEFTVADDDATYNREIINEKPPRLKSYAQFDTGILEAGYNTDVVLIDHFWVEDLLPNKTYTFKNVALRNSVDGTIVATTDDYVFTTDSVTTEFDVKFEFDSSILSSGTYVVTGELHRNDRPNITQVAIHYDLADWDESIVKVAIGTFAFDKSKDESDKLAKYLLNDEKGIVRDRVDYYSAVCGTTYKVNAKLVDEDGNVVSEVTVDYTVPNGETTTDGYFYVDIPVDSTLYNGHTLTVFEYIYHNDILISAHEDLTDSKQQVYIPSVKTIATEVVVTGEEENEYWFELSDLVIYTNLPPHTECVGTMTVMDKETGKPLVDEEGNTYTADVIFTTDESGSGSYVATVKIPYYLVQGKTYSVFEAVYTDGIDLAHHYEWDDNDQIVHFPKITTNAWYVVNKDTLSLEDGDVYTKHIPHTQATVNLMDIVDITNLEKGKTYSVIGTAVMVDADGVETLIGTGEQVKFVATDDSETVAVNFYGINIELLLNTSGARLVIAEYLYDDGMNLIGKHYDMTDYDQTLRSPIYKTEATDTADTDKYIYNVGEQVIIDLFTYEDVMPGIEQKVVTWLVDEYGNAILDPNGNRYEVITYFTPTETSGEFIIEIPVDGAYLEGRTITVFENVYENDTLIGIHHDLSKEHQTVYVPYVRTHGSYASIVDTNTQTHKVLDPTEEGKQYIEITDVLEYKNFPVEELFGIITLVDKETGEPLVDVNGEVIAKEYTFNNETENGSYNVVIRVDIESIREKSFVLFEEVYRIVEVTNDDGTTEIKRIPLAEHKDLNDEEQTIILPTLETIALDYITEDHVGYTNSDVTTVVDTVLIYNAKPNHPYKLVARLANVNESTEDEIVFIDIEPVVVEIITPEDVPEVYEVLVSIDVPTELLQNQTVVAFETLMDNGVELAFHADLTDENQTVEYKDPTISTTAVNATDDERLANDITVIHDRVDYTNLKVGQEYTLEATVMNKATGEVMLDAEGNPYVFTHTFTAETVDGFEIVECELAHQTVNGATIVMFERLYVNYESDNKILIASHEDIDDEAQTVQLPLEARVVVTKKSAGTYYYLAGAEITIFDQDGNIVTDKYGKPAVGVTDEHGIIVFELFVDNDKNYYAQETKAPAGYEINHTKFMLVRDENGVLVANIELEILDELIIIPPTPQTGDNNSTWVWIALIAIAVCGIGGLILVNLKKGKKE